MPPSLGAVQPRGEHGEHADGTWPLPNPHPPQPVLPEDSAVTRAEKVERHGAASLFPESPAKRVKLDLDRDSRDGRRGVAPIKAEYLVAQGAGGHEPAHDDDAAEGAGRAPGQPRPDDRDGAGGRKDKKDRKKNHQGQNTNRDFGSSRDALQLCSTRQHAPEFSPAQCRFAASCKYEHDLRRYLGEGKREDLQTFDALCPLWKARGSCGAGWKCRFVGSHSRERETEDGRKELVLLDGSDSKEKKDADAGEADDAFGLVNVVSAKQKIDLAKRKIQTPKADAYTAWLNELGKEHDEPPNDRGRDGDVQDHRATFVDPPFLPSEKRRIYYGPETPVLAPLTTQGNLPFRRLCVSLGAQITWSEMAMGLPLVQGQKSEWALMKAHESEMSPPAFRAEPGARSVVKDYDNAKDFKFGAQIAANKPWIALKTTEVLTALCPSLRAVDLNCGCPIDLVYRQGAGSALLDQPAKLEKMVRGMNAVSGEVPITVKIRMGTKDGKATAGKLCERLTTGGWEARDSSLGPPGVAAITLHGRSRQQRYTRSADWTYISECATLIARLNEERERTLDTSGEPDERHMPNGGKTYFVGNGDCYSHEDYQAHMRVPGLDSVMVARGALIKPWIFEEIASGTYMDKSASERLSLVEKYAKFGLEAWGSDEIGVGITRRFLLEWLSFACRYVPIGLLEYLPPHIQDRPPAFRGRNELEDLLSSNNYKHWIKISEMFLGPAHKDFKFLPKHKSNSYEIEAEG